MVNKYMKFNILVIQYRYIMVIKSSVILFGKYFLFEYYNQKVIIFKVIILEGKIRVNLQYCDRLGYCYIY